MKETSLLDVLLFLVTNHISEQSEADREKLKAELEQAGIPLDKLARIAGWLKELLQNIELQTPAQPVLRVFNEDECEKIDVVARGCILFLEQTGALKANMREWLIDHAMDLEVEQISIDELQHLLSLVLFQQYGQLNLLKPDNSLIITNPQAIH